MSPGLVLALVLVACVVVIALAGLLRAVLAGRTRQRRAPVDPGGSETGRAVLGEIARPRRRKDGES